MACTCRASHPAPRPGRRHCGQTHRDKVAAYALLRSQPTALGTWCFTYLSHATTSGQYLASTKTFQQAAEFDAPSQTGAWGDPNFVFDNNNNGTAVYFYAVGGGLTVHLP